MSKLLKRFLVDFFSLSKSEQKGIVILTILIILLVVAKQFLPLLIHHPKLSQVEYLEKVKAFQQKQQELSDSIYLTRKQARGKLNSAEAIKVLKPFPFNPNGLSDSSWLAMGLSEKQAATLKNYEAKGGKFYNKEDFRKIYGISEGEYLVLEPFIEIPEPSQKIRPKKKKTVYTKKEKSTKSYYSLIELNEADSALIVKRLKFPSWIAVRIIKFRNLLGGFYSVDQLSEVYSMDSIEVDKRRNFIEIDTTLIRKIELNTATFKQLVNHPYISYELTKNIVNSRSKKGNFTTTYDLVTQEIISDSLYQKLQHYLLVP